MALFSFAVTEAEVCMTVTQITMQEITTCFVPVGGGPFGQVGGPHCTGPIIGFHFLWWLMLYRRRSAYSVLTFSPSLLLRSKPQASQTWPVSVLSHASTCWCTPVLTHSHRSPDISPAPRILVSLRLTLWIGLNNTCSYAHEYLHKHTESFWFKLHSNQFHPEQYAPCYRAIS